MRTTLSGMHHALAALLLAATPALADDNIVSRYASALDAWAYSLGERDRCYNKNSREDIETEARLGSEAIAPGMVAALFGDREAARRNLRGPATGKYWEGRMSDDSCFMVIIMEESRREVVVSFRELIAID